VKQASSASPQALKVIEVMASGGGKTSMVNINVLQEALEQLGWGVEEGTSAAKLDDSDQLQNLLSDWLKAHEGKAWGYTGIKEPKEFWFQTDAAALAALKTLPRYAERSKSTPAHPKRGALYYGTIKRGTGQGDRPGLISMLWWLGVVSYKFSAPNGNSVVVSPSVDYLGRVADVTKMKLARFWTWGYKNGLKESAQAYLASGGQDQIEKQKRDKELAVRSLDNTGTCPCCFRNVKMLQRRQILSRHGWEVQGGGWRNYGAWHTGPCFGTSYPPFELSKQGTVDYREVVHKTRDQISKALTALKKRPSEIKVLRGRKTFSVGQDDPSYEHHLKVRITQVESDLLGSEEALRNLDSKISGWKQEPLPGAKKMATKLLTAKQMAAYLDTPANGEMPLAAELLTRLLGRLKSLYWQHWTAHWQTAGPNSYGDHLLFERLKNEVEEEIDPLAEKIVGYFGERGVNPYHVMNHELEGMVKEPDLVSKALYLEQDFQELLEDTVDQLEEMGALTLGLEDFLPSMASTHDSHLFLLQQRLGGQAEFTPAPLARQASGLFDDLFDVGEVAPDLSYDLRVELERKLGEQGQVLEAAPMFSGSVHNLIGDRVYYFTRSRAWFVYIDAPAPQAVAQAKRAQKKLRGSRSVQADQIILRGRTLYVGSNDGKLTAVKPHWKAAIAPAESPWDEWEDAGMMES